MLEVIWWRVYSTSSWPKQSPVVACYWSLRTETALGEAEAEQGDGRKWIVGCLVGQSPRSQLLPASVFPLDCETCPSTTHHNFDPCRASSPTPSYTLLSYYYSAAVASHTAADCWLLLAADCCWLLLLLRVTLNFVWDSVTECLGPRNRRCLEVDIVGKKKTFSLQVKVNDEISGSNKSLLNRNLRIREHQYNDANVLLGRFYWTGGEQGGDVMPH